ncbi:hypothetical protein [Roseimicrobium sp. ORNL1]|uniref:hypothetical protein n=1 Tax=Roseimicrobium sp. ORNL1 TaxID=2711231 RepID=UPI0019825590|nr:hypothetical protein [Roseimicrobium sp. ORNL1]
MLALCLGCPLAGNAQASQIPVGYDWMVQQNGGEKPDITSHPHKPIEYALQWARTWEKSLAFFTSELDSSEPARVKTSIWCMAMLVIMVEQTATTEAKAQFEKAFPLEKLKQVRAAHPEYEMWFSGLRNSKFGAAFPPRKGAAAP